MICHNPDFCTTFSPPRAEGREAAWPEKFKRVCGLGRPDDSDPPQHPPVAGYLAGFVAFVAAMMAAAALVTDQLPLVVVGL
jgi:hypothetical protein